MNRKSVLPVSRSKARARRGRGLLGVVVFLLILGFESCAFPDFPNSPIQEGRLRYDPQGLPLVLTGTWEYRDAARAPEAAESISPRFVSILLRAPLLEFEPETPPARSYSVRIEVVGNPRNRNYCLSLPTEMLVDRISVNGRSVEGRDGLYFFSSRASTLALNLDCPAGRGSLEARGLVPRGLMFGETESLSLFRIWAGSVFLLGTGLFVLAGLSLIVLFVGWRRDRHILAIGCYLIAAGGFFFARNLFSLPGGLFPLADVDFWYLLALALYGLCFGMFLLVFLRKRLGLALRLVLFIAPPLIAVGALVCLPPARMLIRLILLGWFGLSLLVALAYSFVSALKGSRRGWGFFTASLLAVAALTLRSFAPESTGSVLLAEPLGFLVLGVLVAVMLITRLGAGLESSVVLSDYVASVSATLKRFIPQEFLEALNKRDLVDLRLGDHVKKEMTIFFSDIRAFTELSEKLTVEENFAFINSYLSRVVPIITEHGGFVDKYVGDGIMALFPGTGGADGSIRSAIEMQAKIIEYNEHRAKMGYRPISMGVGVHTGALMLGVVGVRDRMENTVISDAVNLASRLQAITKAFNIPLAISEQTFKELEDPGVYKYRFIGKVKVKGKAAPVSVFEIYDGLEPELFERKMKANTFFEQGMLAYYQKDFAGAMYYFKRVLDALPEDGAAAFYLENCINKAAL